jgi:hypothetical protein
VLRDGWPALHARKLKGGEDQCVELRPPRSRPPRGKARRS